MPPAIIGGVIAGVGAVAGSAIASKGASNAAKTSAAASDRASAVQEENYNKSAATLSPYVNAGVPATQAINALLGLPGAQQAPAASMAPAAAPTGFPSGNWHGIAQMIQGQPQGGQTVTAQAPAATSAPVNYNSAFDNYRNSTGYQFRLNQGLDAVNSDYAGSGTLQSGAAMKSLNDYGQGMASQEFGNYLGALGNQQALGLSAASAQAGVGQNFANSLGQISMANGANQANAALIKAQNTGQMVNSLATIGATIAGGK